MGVFYREIFILKNKFGVGLEKKIQYYIHFSPPDSPKKESRYAPGRNFET